MLINQLERVIGKGAKPSLFLKKHFDSIVEIAEQLDFTHISGLLFDVLIWDMSKEFYSRTKEDLFDGKEDQWLIIAKNAKLFIGGNLDYVFSETATTIYKLVHFGLLEAADMILQRCHYGYQFPLVLESRISNEPVDLYRDHPRHRYKRFFECILYSCMELPHLPKLKIRCLELIKPYVEEVPLFLHEITLSIILEFLRSEGAWTSKLALVELYQKDKIKQLGFLINLDFHRGLKRLAEHLRNDVSVLLMCVDVASSRLPTPVAASIASYVY